MKKKNSVERTAYRGSIHRAPKEIPEYTSWMNPTTTLKKILHAKNFEF